MSNGEDSFAHALGRTACAQIIYAQAERAQRQTNPRQSAGRGGARLRPISASTIHATESATEALSDIAAAFIENIGRIAARRTQLTGRTDSTLLDVLGALETLAPVTNSSPRDLARYAMYQEVPFPYQVPEFPVVPPVKKRKKEVYVEAADGATEKGKSYVEAWMPPLPSAHTYVATPVFLDKGDEKSDPSMIDRQRRRVEKSLAKLKEKKGGRGKDDLMKVVAMAVPDNPFMAMPKVGNGRVFDDDGAGEVREVVEGDVDVEEGVDSNYAGLMDAPKGAAYEQKRQRVERILAEGGAGTTVVSGKSEPTT